jgi:hypothetical protein
MQRVSSVNGCQGDAAHLVEDIFEPGPSQRGTLHVLVHEKLTSQEVTLGFRNWGLIRPRQLQMFK